MMDVERAFERRKALLERLARIERTGSALLFDPGPDMRRCKGAVNGQHGTPTYSGLCPYCDKRIRTATTPPMAWDGYAHRNVDLDERVDPLTLGVRDVIEREDPPRTGGWQKTPTGRRR